MEQEIRAHAEQAIKNKVFPGCVIGIVKKDGERKLISKGNFTYEDDSPHIQSDSIFDVASITKAIPTSSLALQLIDEGRLSTEDKLITYIPEFRNSDRERVLIKHLLTYTLALEGPRLATFKEKSPDEIMEYVFTHEFADPPGTVFKYSNLPAALMSMVVERIHSDTLDNLAEKHFFEPLKMQNTTFYPEHLSKEKIVPTEIDEWRGLVQGVVHDESAYLLKTKANKIVGYAGLFSTTPDILNFLEMLLNEGFLNGKKYFSQEIVGQMCTNQISELGDSTGLGWELNQPRFMGSKCGSHTFGKTGFTGTLCVCDVERGIAYVILTNRIFPKRPPDSSAINAFRSVVADIIFTHTS